MCHVKFQARPSDEQSDVLALVQTSQSALQQVARRSDAIGLSVEIGAVSEPDRRQSVEFFQSAFVRLDTLLERGKKKERKKKKKRAAQQRKAVSNTCQHEHEYRQHAMRAKEGKRKGALSQEGKYPQPFAPRQGRYKVGLEKS